MKNINREKIGIFLIIISLIILTGAVIMCFIPKTEEQMISNNIVLSEEATIELLKEARRCLTKSANLAENVFTDKDMVDFAFEYMGLVDSYAQHITYVEGNELAITDIRYISEVVEYVFGVKNIDFASLDYKVEQNKIYIPLDMQGGDMQIYKYKTTEYDEKNNTYIAYIDCIEVVGETISELMQATELEYSKDDIVCTLAFKYKIVSNRKVLLAYNAIANF